MVCIRHGKLGMGIRIMYSVAELKINTLIIETMAHAIHSTRDSTYH